MKNKKQLFVVLAAFIFPVIISAALFYYAPSFFRSNTVNYGELVKPIITVKKGDIIFKEDSVFNPKKLWTIAYVTNQCDDYCLDVLKDMKTIHVLTNDNVKRIQRLLLIDERVIEKNKDDKLLIAKLDNNVKKKLEKFPNNSLFLIDPLGNIMLRYNSNNIDIKLVVKDLKRLLRYSRIG